MVTSDTTEKVLPLLAAVISPSDWRPRQFSVLHEVEAQCHGVLVLMLSTECKTCLPPICGWSVVRRGIPAVRHLLRASSPHQTGTTDDLCPMD